MRIEETLSMRDRQHGEFQQQAAMSQALKSKARHSRNWEALEPFQREAIEFILLKVSRILHGDADFYDHWRDISGYALLVEQNIEKMRNVPLKEDFEE